jgi:hypothetical protein
MPGPKPVIKEIPPLHVVVKFGSEIPLDIQGPALLEFEQVLRRLALPGMWIEVFKEAKGDDSKLRAAMTQIQRDKL